jgi:hypothetical protein
MHSSTSSSSVTAAARASTGRLVSLGVRGPCTAADRSPRRSDCEEACMHRGASSSSVTAAARAPPPWSLRARDGTSVHACPDVPWAGALTSLPSPCARKAVAAVREMVAAVFDIARNMLLPASSPSPDICMCICICMRNLYTMPRDKVQVGWERRRGESLGWRDASVRIKKNRQSAIQAENN